jgi:hypothetical protein
MRYANPPGFSYNIVGLTPGATYTVRLHFVEPTLFGANLRVFNVTFNGTAFLTNFDIYVAAGNAGNKAVAEVGTATADANGQISISFSNITNDPLVCAIEILSSTPSSSPSPHVLTVGSKQTTTASYPVATLPSDQFFTLEEAGHSEGGANRLSPFGFLFATEWKPQLLNHTVSGGAFLGKEPSVSNHSWEPRVLTRLGNGCPDDSKRDPIQVQDEGPDGTDWTVTKKDLAIFWPET